jgi:hypothetical protein
VEVAALIQAALTAVVLEEPTLLETVEMVGHLEEALMAQLAQMQQAMVLAVAEVVRLAFKAETQPAGLVGQVPQA